MRQRIGVKIGILFLIFFAEISVFTGLFYAVVFQHDRYMDKFQDLVEQKDLVERLRLGLAQVVMPVNDFLIIGADPNEKKNFDALAAQVEELFRVLGDRNSAFPSPKGIIDHIQGEYFTGKEISLRIFAMADPVGNPRAGALMEEVDARMDDAVKDAGEYHRIIELDIEDMNKNWVRQHSVFLAVFSGILLVFIGVVVWAMSFVRRHISRPLISLKDSALRIAGGDFHLKVEAASQDEIGELAGAFNTMVEHLNTSYNEIEAHKEELEAANRHLVEANAHLGVLRRGLEDQVKSRTLALEEANQKLAEKIEDVVESRDQLLKTNIELSKAKDALEQFSKNLEEKVKARTFELSVLYELSNAISYTLDYRQLLRIIMESLDRIVPHEVSASLIFDRENADITVRPRYPSCLKFVDEVKTILIDSAALMTGIDMSKRQVVSYIMTPESAETEAMDAVRSFFNIPFFVRGQMIGLIHVSSHKEDAFGQDDIRLMYTIANQASTAIEKLQTVIKTEKSKMESMVESMTEGVIMTDERGAAVVLNPRARQMLDFAPDLEVSARMLDHKFRAVGLHETLKECRKKDGLVSKEIVMAQEKDLVLKCDMAPVRDEEGKTIGIAMILIDVTKERELKRLKDEFVSTVSHELRTPLSISTEGINLVLDGITGAVSEQQKEILQTAKDNLSRLAAIINDLLDISKIEAGKISLNRRLIDFGGLVEHFAGVYQKVLSTKKQTIEIHLPSAPFFLYADRDKIIQVLTNLLNNAHKFTPEGGKIEVALAVQGGEFLCSVKDNGPGITKEDMAKLFGKFEQFGRTYGPGMKGTGLGLSIAKALVELHGGKIWAESRPGEGTSFLFTLPSYETVRTDFNSHLDRVLEEALASRQPVSLMMVHLRNHEIIQKRYGERILHDIMDIIEGVAGKIVSKPADRFILYDVHTICAVLPATNKTGVLAVIRRFKEAMKTCVFPIEEKGDLEVAFGSALYPLQGKDREGLVKAALEDVTRKRRILVVDDNPEIHSVLQANFADQQALLEPALDGQEALDKIHERMPDLIILDIMLPKMNGYELLGRLKHDPRTASIPVVILTAKERGDVEREFKDFEEIPIIGKVGGFEKIVAMAKELL